MTDPSPLTSAPLIAFVATRDPSRAREFYQRVLGLELVSEDQFALVFNSDGTMLRVATVQELIPAKYTVLGWNVASIEKTIDDLKERGVQFERFGFFEQDARGIWTAPSGARVAWFKDADSNLLSISQH
jgi:catechol 2,3-dioxygenase-like lactoylglutathione lyase family enzyme